MQVTVTAANGTGSFNVDAEAIILCEPRNGGSYLTIDRNTGASDQIEVVEAPSTIATDSGNLLFQATLVPVPLVVQASFAFDGLSGSFIIGERVNFNQGFATLQSISGSNMVLVDYTGASISDNSIIVGADSGALCLVNGSVTFSYPQAVSTYINVGRCHELKPYSVGLSSLVYDYAVPKLETLFTTLTEAQLVAASAAAGGGGSGWSLTGNAGTNPYTDFLGTTDAQQLNIATDGNVVAVYQTDGSYSLLNGTFSQQYDDGASNTAQIVNGISNLFISRAYTSGQVSAIEINETQGIIISTENGGDVLLQSSPSNDNVGIGTTTPAYKLDVVGSLKSVNTDFSIENTDLALLGATKASVNKYTPTADETYFSGVVDAGAGTGLSQNGYINTNTTVGTFAYAGPTSASIQYKADYTSATDYVGVVAGSTEVTVKSMATMDTEKVVSFENGSGEVAKIDGIGTFTAPTLTLTTVPAYDDDAAAGTGGLLTGQLYQTTGLGAAPLNAAGILMIKQ